uniref:G_PROTEIN_RECEP_F1_2 domain-containing protein n=1 Tax=Rhabditophanes sp. KR3021 TaxID=114890 RepID=A0AC35TQW5_9BILA
MVELVNTSKTCLDAFAIGTNNGLAAIWMLLILVTIISLAMSVIVLILLLTGGTVHFFFKVLLANLLLTLILRGIGSLVRATFFLFHYFQHTTNECDFTFKQSTCIIITAGNSVWAIGTLFAIGAAVFERLIATFLFKTYENKKSYIIAMLITLAIIGYPVYLFVLGYLGFLQALERNVKIPFCTSGSIGGPPKINTSVIYSIPGTLLLFVVSLAVRIYLKKKQTNIRTSSDSEISGSLYHILSNYFYNGSRKQTPDLDFNLTPSQITEEIVKGGEEGIKEWFYEINKYLKPLMPVSRSTGSR